MCVLQKVESDPEEIRRQMELQLEAWHKQAPGTLEEVRLTQQVVFLHYFSIKKQYSQHHAYQILIVKHLAFTDRRGHSNLMKLPQL